MKGARFRTESTEVHREPPRYGGLHDQAAKAVLQAKDVEIHQKSYPIRTHPEVREKLGRVHGAQSLDRLNLQDQFMRNHNIRAKPGFQKVPTVNDRHRNLTSEFKCSFRQFEAKAFLIDRLELSGTELPVDGNSQSNDTFGQCMPVSMTCLRGSLWSSVFSVWNFNIP
jgi:hypothetical protein